VSPEVAVRWSEICVREHDADEAVLDDRERRRAAAIRHPDARVRFVTAHAALRQLLAEVLDAEPATFRITADRLGRPRVMARTGWSISLAHTHDAVVVAAGHAVEIGVDIERLDRDRLPPAGRWCTAAEVSACRAAGVDARLLALRLWTGKEALAKAAGVGMRMPFHECGVLEPIVPDPRPGSDRGVPATGTVRWLDLSPRHAVALATLPVTHGPGVDRRGSAVARNSENRAVRRGSRGGGDRI
jgi:4'-phosphopantetheinyl transferase